MSDLADNVIHGRVRPAPPDRRVELVRRVAARAVGLDSRRALAVDAGWPRWRTTPTRSWCGRAGGVVVASATVQAALAVGMALGPNHRSARSARIASPAFVSGGMSVRWRSLSRSGDDRAGSRQARAMRLPRQVAVCGCLTIITSALVAHVHRREVTNVRRAVARGAGPQDELPRHAPQLVRVFRRSRRGDAVAALHAAQVAGRRADADRAVRDQLHG